MTDNRDTDRHTTVVQTERRGGGGTIALAIVLLLIVVLLFVFWSDIFGGSVSNVPEKIDVEVSVPGTKTS